MKMVNFGSALSLEKLDERVASLENNPAPKAQHERELLLAERGRRENLPKIEKMKYPCMDCKKSSLYCVNCKLFKRWHSLPVIQRDCTQKKQG